jgi:Mrp family chromosome partitioning ATPase
MRTKVRTTYPIETETVIERVARSRGPDIGLAEGPFLESFRLLALNVNHMLEGRPWRSILVMSALPGDGRTMTATFLARAMAEVAPPVMLVDADPYGARAGLPAITPAGSNGSSKEHENGHHRLYNYKPRTGLSAREFLGDVIATVGVSSFDAITIVIDTPPCLNSTIAFGLAANVSGVVYVSRPASGRRPPHSDIRNQLDILGATVFGIVVNEG